MILVTGGTGFIGRVLIRQLVAMGKNVRTLIRPSPETPQLPKGVPIEVAVSSLKDPRGLRAAMKDVEVVYHLVGVEGKGSRANLMDVDIQGTQAVVQAAREAGVARVMYVSHLGADRASAYPIFKTKGIAENFLRQSGLDYTIFRTGIAFGPNDHFTTGLAFLLHALPSIFLIPGDGSNLLQPIWVEDLATCLVWALEDSGTRNQTFSLGGPEFLPFVDILHQMMDVLAIRRTLVSMGPAYLRSLTVLFEDNFPAFPVSGFWLDYLAADRTSSLDTLPRAFGLLPSKFSQRLDHLRGQSWQRNFIKLLLQRK